MVSLKFENGNPQIGSPQKLFQNPAIDNWFTLDGQRFLITERSLETVNAPVTLVSNWPSIVKHAKQ